MNQSNDSLEKNPKFYYILLILFFVTQALYKTFYLILAAGLVTLISLILYSLKFCLYVSISADHPFFKNKNVGAFY